MMDEDREWRMKDGHRVLKFGLLKRFERLELFERLERQGLLERLEQLERLELLFSSLQP